MTSAAAAASGTPGLGGSPTGFGSGAYAPWLSLEEWRKKTGSRWQKGSRDEWDMWQGDMSLTNRELAQRPIYKKAPEVIEPEEEENEVGSTPGFEKVQRFLRQQRATGRVVSPQETRAAWQGYWDAWAGKQAERERLGLAEKSFELSEKSFEWQKKMDQAKLDLSDEQMDAAESGNIIGGIADIFTIGIFSGIF